MKDIEDIKFNLNPKMADKLVKINNLKVRLYDINMRLKDEKKNVNDAKLVNEREKILKKIENLKKDFIKEFQINNKDQIIEYLELKNKNK